MKISVLTPTYNDSETIEETLCSLVDQSYSDWEWIVINDGSTDNTEKRILELIKKYDIEDKCKYVYQENKDQLNALINGTTYITGDYVFVLHSDDLLPDKYFFEKCIEEMKKDETLDGIFGDLIIIDENSKVVGEQKVPTYYVHDNIPPLMLLWMGRNLYSDVAFHKKETYVDSVKYNYLTWNMPLWLDTRNDKVRMLNYKSVSFPVLKYRVHSGNYINNEIGKMNVINGELRTATELMNHYSVDHYERQYFKFRLKNKLMPSREYKVKYKKQATADRYNVVSFIINKRYKPEEKKPLFLEALLGFYRADSERNIEIEKIPENLNIYYGKDIRSFNKKLLSGDLESFYMNFMNEMKQGFKTVYVSDSSQIEQVKDMLRFFCISHIDVRSRS